MITKRYVGWLWLLSGVPVGIAFLFLPIWAIGLCIAAFAWLQTSHQLSPIVLAWAHRGFRAMMLTRPAKYLLLPAAAFGLALAAPLHVKVPVGPWALDAGVTGVYLAWNAYHYGMQHFGVLSIWRRPRHRYVWMAACVAFGAAGLAVPFATSRLLLAVAAMAAVNHYVTDIGLSGRVLGRHGWLFVVGVLLLGTLGYVFYEPTLHGFHRRSDMLIQVSMAIGFVHFLYSRWDWRRGSPIMAAA